MVSSELLKSINAFREMNDEQIAKIQKHCEIFEYKKEERLFAEGDPATHLWNVLEGLVEARFEMPDRRPRHPSQAISYIEVGEQTPEAKVMGWSCFIPPFKMRLSAYCVTPKCKVLRIENKALLKLLDQDPQMGYKFLSYMITVVGYRFHQFQDHVAKNMGEDLMSGW